jgi:hypothetical protein
MTATINRKPGIPQAPPVNDRELHRFLVAIKEHAEVAQGVRGSSDDRYVTVGMLVRFGLITSEQARGL